MKTFLKRLKGGLYKRFVKHYWKLESLCFELRARLPRLRKPDSVLHSLPGALIISLTSFPPRFRKLPLTIKCLLRQSVSPDLIILWIAHSDQADLTTEILDLESDCPRFQIRYCDDYRSYKKLIPTLEEYPEAFVVTADDDVFYPRWWLKHFCDNWDGDFNAVISYRVHGVTFVETSVPEPYRKWNHRLMNTANENSLFATGIAGVLYPPSCLDKRVLDKETFLRICPNADDVWFFWMTRLNGSTVRKTTDSFNVVNWLGSDQSGLAIDNVSRGGNDKQIQNMIGEFGWPE